MTKSKEAKRTRVAVIQSKANPCTAPKKSSAIAVAKKTVPVGARKGDVQSTGKIATITALLRRPTGASIDDLVKATGWQAHSVRGAISAAIKKKLGLNVTSEKMGAVRLYRIADKAAG